MKRRSSVSGMRGDASAEEMSRGSSARPPLRRSVESCVARLNAHVFQGGRTQRQRLLEQQLWLCEAASCRETHCLPSRARLAASNSHNSAALHPRKRTRLVYSHPTGV